MPQSSGQKIFFLIGPIGSGKGTQAELLVDDFSVVHCETSKLIEDRFANADEHDPVMMREKENFRTGKLVNPEIVLRWVIERITEIHAEGKGIVFSASPRTVPEVLAELPVLESLYGRENILTISIALSEDESVRRNSKRRICTAHRHPIPNFPQFEGISVCPWDGSPVKTRILDTPDVIRVRYRVFKEETAPVLDTLRDKEYPILTINGEQSIRDVHRAILNALEPYTGSVAEHTHSRLEDPASLDT